MAIWNPFGKKNNSDENEPQSDENLAPASEVADELAANGDSTQPTEPAAPEGNLEPETNVESAPADEPKRGMFGRLKSALKKTTDFLNTDLRDIVKKEGRLVDEEFLDELYAFLVKTDMGIGPAGKIRDGIKSKFRGRKVFMKDLIESAKGTISEIMEQDSAEINFADNGPTVVMVVGVNGAGKTTSIAKLVHRFKEQGKSVVLGAGDTFRAAAVEQLTVWAERMGAEIITGRQGSDPASVAYKATEAAYKNGIDVCIIDTAGRLQTQNNLMDELGRIRRVIEKASTAAAPDSAAPHEVLLVLDATAGQNAISQASGFSGAAGCTGIILAKLDGTAKGGVAIPIRQEFGLPVKFIGLGETPDAMAAFDVQTYVDAMFDETEE
jgi:fused signal recognition particle receptor